MAKKKEARGKPQENGTTDFQEADSYLGVGVIPRNTKRGGRKIRRRNNSIKRNPRVVEESRFHRG